MEQRILESMKQAIIMQVENTKENDKNLRDTADKGSMRLDIVKIKIKMGFTFYSIAAVTKYHRLGCLK